MGAAAEPCRESTSGPGDMPILADIVSVSAEGEGATVVIARGAASGLTRCKEARVCTASRQVTGLVVEVSENQAVVKLPVPPEAIAGCERAVVDRAPPPR